MKNRLKNVVYKLLSNDWATLHRVDYDFLFQDGTWKRLSRERYDRGDGTCVLLYNIEKGTVVLTRQFRLPLYDENNFSESMSIEVCAGSIDNNEQPEKCIIREVKEETGYEIKTVKRVYESYMSPGAVTEKLFMFVAEYSDDMKVDSGGGLEIEGEEIEVLELSFSEALRMIETKEIKDAKTIMLLQYAQIHKLLK